MRSSVDLFKVYSHANVCVCVCVCVLFVSGDSFFRVFRPFSLLLLFMCIARCILYRYACMYDHLRFYFVDSARSPHIWYCMCFSPIINSNTYNIYGSVVLWDAKSSTYNTLKKRSSQSHPHSLTLFRTLSFALTIHIPSKIFPIKVLATNFCWHFEYGI